MIVFLKLLSRFLIGWVFLFRGYQKVFTSYIMNFDEILKTYDVFPGWAIPFLSYAVPLTEIALGVFLILGFLTRLTYLVTSLFFSIFIIVITRALILQIEMESCGCFGEALRMPLANTLVLDIILLVLTLMLLLTKPTPLRVDSLIFKK